MNNYKWCEHCGAAQDTAKIWKLKCIEGHRHKFAITNNKIESIIKSFKRFGIKI